MCYVALVTVNVSEKGCSSCTVPGDSAIVTCRSGGGGI